jgi:hypothetical protein
MSAGVNETVQGDVRRRNDVAGNWTKARWMVALSRQRPLVERFVGAIFDAAGPKRRDEVAGGARHHAP